MKADVTGSHGPWCIKFGELRRAPGRPGGAPHLFRVVGEKLPFQLLPAVKKDLSERGLGLTGVYIAHDSMGCPRYIGRGRIFTRLKAHKKAHPLELLYFSFYVVEESNHEREIETLLIRSAGFLLHFNDRKKRMDIEPGVLGDYEPGTFFYERQKKRGRAPKTTVV